MDERDGGETQDSPVRYMTAPGMPPGSAILSGGVVIHGWSPVSVGSLVYAADITHLPPTVLTSRHLFVNDVVAPRTSVEGSDGFQRSIWADSWILQSRSDVVWSNGTSYANASAGGCNSLGFELKPGTHAETALAWRNNGSGVELIFSGTNAAWAEARCAVRGVVRTASGGALLIMAQPCHCSYAYKCLLMVGGSPRVYAPTGIVNTGPIENGSDPLKNESVSIAAGTWWLDRVEKRVFYSPPIGVDMSTASIMIGSPDVLISGNGVSNLYLSGIGFRHTTWRQPASDAGCVEVQSGQNINQYFWPNNIYSSIIAPQSAVTFVNASHVTIDACDFTELGGHGASFAPGSNNTVSRSYFHNISGMAVQIGSFNGPNCVTHPEIVNCSGFSPYPNTPKSLQDTGNSMLDSVVVSSGREYRGTAAVAVGYTVRTVIANTTIVHVPSTGITIGWGWGYKPSYNRQNMVVRNRIHDFKTTMKDGGCIYLQGDMPGTLLSKNWCSQMTAGGGGALYPDEGSQNMMWLDNVVSNLGGDGEWLHIWTGSIHNQYLSGNFHDGKANNKGINTTIINDHQMVDGIPPPETAWKIMNVSGASSGPWPLPHVPDGPQPPPSPPPPAPGAPGVWTLTLKGHLKTLPELILKCNGTQTDRFKVIAVTAGGADDPHKGYCKQWNIDTQDVIQISADDGKTWQLAPTVAYHSEHVYPPGCADCGNAHDGIISLTFGASTSDRGESLDAYEHLSVGTFLKSL